MFFFLFDLIEMLLRCLGELIFIVIDCTIAFFKKIFLAPFLIYFWIKRKLVLICKTISNVLAQLNRIEALLLAFSSAASIEFYTIIEGKKEKVVEMFLKQTEQLPLAIEVKDAKGNAAKVDGAPQWSTSNADVGTLAVSEDGFSAVFTPGAVIGQTVIQVLVDADLGEGVKQILGTLDLEVVSGEAVSVAIIAGAPQPF